MESAAGIQNEKLCDFPAIGSDGTVYFDHGITISTIPGKTGTKIWEFETGNDVRSSPAIGSDGIVYVGSLTKALCY